MFFSLDKKALATFFLLKIKEESICLFSLLLLAVKASSMNEYKYVMVCYI